MIQVSYIHCNQRLFLHIGEYFQIARFLEKQETKVRGFIRRWQNYRKKERGEDHSWRWGDCDLVGWWIWGSDNNVRDASLPQECSVKLSIEFLGVSRNVHPLGKSACLGLVGPACLGLPEQIWARWRHLALAAAAAILILAPNFALAAPPVSLVYLYFYQLYLLVNFWALLIVGFFLSFLLLFSILELFFLLCGIICLSAYTKILQIPCWAVLFFGYQSNKGPYLPLGPWLVSDPLDCWT